MRRQALRDAPLGPPRELIGQPIAIHAAKTIGKWAAAFAEELMYGQHQPGGFELADKLAASMKGAPDELMGIFGQATMPIGCIVCVARLDAAFELGEPAEGTAVPSARVVQRLRSRPLPECFTVRYDDFGAKPLKPPVPMKSQQGFFDLPQDWLVS
jgi:hypothetical protein